MKIRNGFITNSSSTSFIIGDLREDKSKLEIKMKYDLLENDVNCTITINSFGELDSFLSSEEGKWLKLDRYEKELEKIHKILLKNGSCHIIHFINSDLDPNDFRSFLSRNVINKKMVDKGVYIIMHEY